MIESMTDIPMPSGTMDAFIAYPPEGGPFPAVFVLMDFWGIREEFFDIARRVATVGYYAIVPNFYYRQGRVRFEHRDERGRMKSYVTIAESEQQRMQDQLRKLSDEMAMDDIGALLGFLRTQPVTPGPKAAIGYCLGGRYVFQAAHTYPGRIPRHRQHARHAAHDRRAAVAAQAGRPLPR